MIRFDHEFRNGLNHMNDTNQLINIIISSFVIAFKNNRINGLEFNFDFDPIQEVCAYFEAQPVGAYGCFNFELDGKNIFVYSTYGYADAEEHESEDGEHIISMGFVSILINSFIASI